MRRCRWPRRLRWSPGGSARRSAQRSDRRSGRRSARGAVTAELALALPLLLAVTLALVWLLGLGLAQVRVIDAAREGARAIARGDDVGAATGRARDVAGVEAHVSVGRVGDRVEVSVSRDVEGLGGLLDALPAVTLRASAVTVAEGTP